MNYELLSLTLPKIIIIGLAVWRLTSIVHSEKIAGFIRRLAGGMETEGGGIVYPDTFFGNLFSCFWCLSVWCAAIIVGISFVPYVNILNIILASSGIAIIIRLILDKDD